MNPSAAGPRLEVPHRVRLHRAIRCLRVARRARDCRGGPLRDQLDLRSLDALAATERLPARFQAARTRLVASVEASGLPRLPVFTHPRSMFPAAVR